jgi:hypothetical protein
MSDFDRCDSTSCKYVFTVNAFNSAIRNRYETEEYEYLPVLLPLNNATILRMFRQINLLYKPLDTDYFYLDRKDTFHVPNYAENKIDMIKNNVVHYTTKDGIKKTDSVRDYLIFAFEDFTKVFPKLDYFCQLVLPDVARQIIAANTCMVNQIHVK